MFGLALSLPSSTAFSFGGSKLFQILIPLGAYIFFKELPFAGKLIQKIVLSLNPNASPETSEYRVSQLVGFMSWKIGCDMGFLIIATGVAPWSRAFTLSGLIPYTILQYCVYYLIGQKMIILGQLNPFKEGFVPKKITGRPPLWKQFFSKFFHENMNATSANVPMRQVVLKPFVDYGGIIVSWSFYNVGLLFLQSGEINFAPVIHFTFLPIITFYIVNVAAYILGYNLGEFLYLRLLDAIELLEKWRREQKIMANPHSDVSNSFLNAALSQWKEFENVVIWRFQPFLARYGINVRWFVSSTLGVIFIVLLQPYISGPIFSLSDQVKHLWFSTFGQIDQTQLQQVLAASSVGELPSSQELTDGFPARWDAIYFPDAD
ncbi:MAG: hypothetical protein AB4426_13175 [Xenococcaceae cyanobacterium]